jgi:hypothetical protein
VVLEVKDLTTTYGPVTALTACRSRCPQGG